MNSTLSGKDIRECLQAENDADRLVISPLFEHEEQLRDENASIDVRLGFQFASVSPSSYGAIDEFDERWETDGAAVLKKLYKKVYVPLGRELVIHPHQFILAETLEYVRLPHNLMAYVVGRSTWGRFGLIIATAIGVHPGFSGTITLELRNLGESPLTLYPGQCIAQLFFHRVENGIASSEKNNQYGGPSDLVPKKMSSKKTHEKIGKIRAKLHGHADEGERN